MATMQNRITNLLKQNRFRPSSTNELSNAVEKSTVNSYAQRNAPACYNRGRTSHISRNFRATAALEITPKINNENDENRRSLPRNLLFLPQDARYSAEHRQTDRRRDD